MPANTTTADFDPGPPPRPITYFQHFGFLARLAAVFAAVMAGFGAGLAMYEWSNNIFVAIPAGAVLASALGIGYHVILTQVEEASGRRALIGAVLITLVLASVAVATSGLGIVTAIAGHDAQRIDLQVAHAKHTDALKVATSRIDIQAAFPEHAARAAAAYRILAKDEEGGVVSGKPGCGPNCASYKRIADGYEAMANDLKAAVDAAYAKRNRTLDILEDARKAASKADTEAFATQIAEAAANISSLGTLDLSKRVQLVGMVTNSSGQLNQIDVNIREVAQQAMLSAPVVAVPSYAPISNSEAVRKWLHRIWVALAVALGIDLIPAVFVFLLLAGKWDVGLGNPKRPGESGQDKLQGQSAQIYNFDQATQGRIANDH